MSRLNESPRPTAHEWMKEVPAGNAGPRVSVLMHLVAFVPVATLAVYHFVLGNLLVSASLTVMASMLAATVLVARVAPHLCVHVFLDCLFIFTALPTSLWVLFMPDLYVIYLIPALIFAAFFVMPIRLSTPLLAVYTITAIFFFAGQHGFAESLRVGFGLGACYLFTLGLASMMLRQQKQLTELAFLDPLTKAYNRNALFDELAHVMDTAARHQTAASVVMLDIDHFKQINDKHGHAVGDEVLIWLTNQLLAHSRRNDRLFRLGGDEFLLLLPDLNSKEAYRVIELIKERMAPVGAPHQIRITVSAGVAELMAEDSADKWLDKADKALYLAKEDGRNCCRSWQPASSSETGTSDC
ncbi:GGDEF domain-containing protein [Neiella marina]|uniref:diguanylate cyclase n=1 Tax=Neiella holothuriorum TaxID=2870530 RepID=A0ABS7ED37_9GAMM|nr:GGDEF domain-containing protein [Neiella holothuriorum]MBW8190228.1 GGDEF domain-containing protein [Neiella holothuriorum]